MNELFNDLPDVLDAKALYNDIGECPTLRHIFAYCAY